MNRVMKVSIPIFFICLAFALYMPLNCFAENMNQGDPKISPIEPHYDFGQAPEGENVVHIFKIRNTGGSDLVIHQARGT